MSTADVATTPVSSAEVGPRPIAGAGHDFSGLARLAGIAGLLIAFVGLFLDPVRFGMSWLIGYTFWFAILVGCLFLVMLSYIFDAGWSTIVRRQWEHALSAFPWMFLLLLPVVLVPWLMAVFGDSAPIWEWRVLDHQLTGEHPVAVGDDVLYIKKSGYLNNPFFFFRIALYFLIFSGLAFLLRYFSMENDQFPWKGNYSNARKVSAVGVPLTGLAMTFAAFDLYMSLSYHWFSTMYGVWFFAGAMRIGLAFTVIFCFLQGTRGGLRGLINEAHYYYLGCMKLAFTVFWAYIAFCQYFLIYNANIPEETFWYNLRMLNADGTLNSWWWVGLALIFGYFLAPFIALLWNRTKVDPPRLVAVSIWILAFSLLDYYYNILPREVPIEGGHGATAVQEFLPSVFDLAALVGVGGIVIWATLRSIRRHKAIPIRDPRILESIHASI